MSAKERLTVDLDDLVIIKPDDELEKVQLPQQFHTREYLDMAYGRNAELPMAVRNALPEEAQGVFRAIFNNALDQYDDEERAFATAWAGLRQAGWEKGKDGKWHKTEKIAKADETQLTWQQELQIAKLNQDQQLVFGWLSVVEDEHGEQIVDSQGDIIDAAELEAMAYQFVLYARRAGEMHQRWEGIGRLVESMVFTKDKQHALGIPDGTMPIGWWVGFRVDDPGVWAKIKSGEYAAFSIGGTGERKEVA